MMDFKEETTYATHSNARNLIQYHQKSDALSIRKLHKSGFFHGNSSRNLNLSLTLPTAASNIFFKRTIRSLTKSKRALFIREINAAGWTSKFTPQDEAKFCHLLRKTKKLRNFTLDKTWSEAVAPHFLRQLSKCFSKLYFFKDIKLNLFGSTNIKTEDCEKMGISLSRSLRLEKMDIQLVGCNGIGIKGIHYMFYRFSKLQHLQDLQVNLSNCYCLRNEIGFLKFKDTIGRLPNLQSLNLTLSSNTLVNDECLMDIALGLAKLSTLKKLTISFGGCNMTNDGLIIIGKGITRLVNLEEVRLEFWGCLQIGDEGVGGLLKGFEGLRRLKKVDLNFANCSLITDLGVFAIRESLYKLEGLQSLDIGLFGCSNVEKLAIETLWHKLGGLPKLRDGLNILS